MNTLMIQEQKVLVRAMEKRLKNRTMNGFHTWSDMNLKTSIKKAKQELQAMMARNK